MFIIVTVGRRRRSTPANDNFDDLHLASWGVSLISNNWPPVTNGRPYHFEAIPPIQSAVCLEHCVKELTCRLQSTPSLIWRCSMTPTRRQFGWHVVTIR